MKRFTHSAWILLLVGSVSLLMDGCSLLGGRTREQKILDALRSPDQAEKHKTLLKLWGAQATPAVRKALEGVLATDPDVHARAFAADALGRLGAWGAAEELRRSAREDSHELVRARAIRALAQILGSGAEEDLEFSLKNDPRASVKVEAVRLAAKALGTKQAAQLIVEGLRDKDHPQVKLAAYIALKELTGQDISPNDYDRWQEQVDGK